MMTIFLSHSSRDNDKADALKRRLEAGPLHHTVFLDFDTENGIIGGTDWQQTLYDRLQTCGVVIPLLTENWLASKWCFAEVVHAQSIGKTIVPVKMASCDTPDVLLGIQQIDFTHGEQAGYQQLERALWEVFPWDFSRSPYPGMFAFQEDDAAIFFGRESETLAAVEKLESMRKHRAPLFALVLGASGSGKSSLVRAGVIPRLRIRDSWLPVPAFRPLDAPLRELAIAIAQAYERVQRPRDYAELYAKLHQAADKAHPDGTVLLDMSRDLAIKAQRGEATVLLVLDQAEECFGESSGEQANRFLRLMRAALESSKGRLMALATMRSEFLAAFQKHPFLSDSASPDAEYEKITVHSLPVQRFPEIIRGPARLVQLTIEDELVDRMVQDTGTPDALPLLAYTLGRLWDNETYRADGKFELREYEQLGGLAGSVSKAAEEALGVASEAETLRAAFIPAMVRVNADGTRVRRRAYRDELSERANQLVQCFIDKRLVVTDRDQDGRETVEVTHEALLRTWPQLDKWLKEDQGKLQLLEGLGRAAMDWHDGGRLADFLVHRDSRLQEVEALVEEDRFKIRQDSRERDYLDACIKAQRKREAAEREEQERKVRDAKRFTRVIAIGLVVAVFLALVAVWQEKETRIAQSQALSLVARQKTDEGNATLGQLLALEALEALPKPNAESRAATSLLHALFAQSEQRILRGASQAVNHVRVAPKKPFIVTASNSNTAHLWNADTGELESVLEGHSGWIYWAEFSPNGKMIITASSDGSARLWHLENSKRDKVLNGHSDRVYQASFSRHGKYVVTVSKDRMAQLWDVATGQPLWLFAKHTKPVLSASFSFDNKYLVTASKDAKAIIWSIENGKALATLEGHTGVVFQAIFSPDNAGLVLTASADKTACLWDWKRGQLVKILQGHEDIVDRAAFSPDGKFIATASADGTVRLWDGKRGTPLSVLDEHQGFVRDLEFFSQYLLLTASNDGAVRLWNIDEPTRPIVVKMFNPDRGLVGAARFLPDGRRVAAALEDGTIRISNMIDFTVLSRHKNRVHQAIFSPADNDSRLVTVSDDGTARICDIKTGDVTVLNEHQGAVWHATFSADGTRLVTTSADGTAKLWRAEDATNVKLDRSLEGHSGWVVHAHVSPDGKQIVTGGEDHKVFIWQVDSKEPPVLLTGHRAPVYFAEFSPDGNHLLSFAEDGRALLWDAREKTLIASIEDVKYAAFSHRTRQLATASSDGSARLWDVDNGEPLGVFGGPDGKRHDGEVLFLAFSPDDARLVTTSKDRTARLWDVQSQKLLFVLEGHWNHVLKASFSSPNGRFILTASSDRTARVWHADTGHLIGVLKGHRDRVTRALFAPDQRHIVTASWDGTVRLWDFPIGTCGDCIEYARGHVLRPLTDDERRRYYLRK